MSTCFSHSRIVNPFPTMLRGASRSQTHTPHRRPRPLVAYLSALASTPSPPSLTLFYSDLYKHPLPAGHRFPMVKYELVRAALQKSPIMSRTTFVPAPLATRKELELVHCEGYVQRVLRGKLSAVEIRAIGFPWSLAGVRRSLGSTGGTVAAMREVLRNGGRARLTGHTAGGTHHANRDTGAGFCVFNDLAVAAKVALREFDVRRVLIIDLDVHQGEGTAGIFKGDEEVYTVSLHGEGNYPFNKVMGNVDVGFADETGDVEYLEVVRRVVPAAIEEAKPGLVLLQMGVDGLKEDSLGRLSLTREGMSERNREVYRTVLQAGVPGVITMGGGYSKPTIDGSVDGHCDVYTDAAYALAAW